MEILTHERMDYGLSGEPLELSKDRSSLTFEATEAMRADSRGLVHGGFVFSLADHAAMLAINHPNVVLGSATSKFLRPVRVGDRLQAEAEVTRREGKKIIVRVEVRLEGAVVLECELVCFTPEKHVLDR